MRRAHCDAQGWTLALAPGATAWKREFESASLPYPANPAIDPLTPGANDADTVSIIIRDPKGSLVACSGVRRIVIESVTAALRNGSMNHPLLDVTTLMSSSPLLASIEGSRGYSGGTYINANHRGKRLGLLLTRLARAYTHDMWETNWHLGVIFGARSLAPAPYHLETITHVADGVPFSTLGDAPVYLLTMSRDAHLEQVARDLEQQPWSDFEALAP